MIYYGKQNVNEDDIKAVEEVLRSNFLTQGPAIEKFEKRVAEYCGVKYAVAVTNTLPVKPPDLVWAILCGLLQ